MFRFGKKKEGVDLQERDRQRMLCDIVTKSGTLAEVATYDVTLLPDYRNRIEKAKEELRRHPELASARYRAVDSALWENYRERLEAETREEDEALRREIDSVKLMLSRSKAEKVE